jgi:hypothetical protein
MKTVLLETASDAVASAMGALSTKIVRESSKPNPDIKHIESLKKQLIDIKNERNELDPNDEKAIEAMLDKYSPKRRREREELNAFEFR